MDVNIKDMKDKKYIQLIGRLDGNSSNDVTEKVLDALNESNSIVIDMEECVKCRIKKLTYYWQERKNEKWTHEYN